MHLWTSFEATGREPVRHCILCLVLQSWSEAFDDTEPGLWWNAGSEQLDDRSFAEATRRVRLS